MRFVSKDTSICCTMFVMFSFPNGWQLLLKSNAMQPVSIVIQQKTSLHSYH